MGSIVENFIRRHKKTAASLAAAIALTATFLSDLGGAWDAIKNLIGKPEPLSIIQARLTPIFRHPEMRHGREQASLSLQIRNYGQTEITLTSSVLSVTDGSGISVGEGSSKGGCTLSPNPNENNTLTIAPGQTEWITVGTHVNLLGVSSYLTEQKLSEIDVHSPNGEPFTIVDSRYVDDINRFFANTYGPDAKIKVVIRSIPSEEHVFFFNVAQGKDMYSKDGSLHHDWFIANWKEWRNRKTFAGYVCKHPIPAL